MSKSLTLPTQALQAEILPSSVNVENRTVDVIWSTGAKVGFSDWEIGDYFLTLGLAEENVRLDFARSGAPVLDNHSNWGGVESVKGVIDSISVDGTMGVATLRFSKRPEVDSVWQDVVDGILRFVSVGTRLHRLEDITEEDDKIPHYFATDHEPLEISLANIPRDRGAVMQSEGTEKPERFPVEIVNQSAQAAHKGESKMKDSTKKSAAKQAATDTEETRVEQTEESAPKAPAVETKPESKPEPTVTQADIDAAVEKGKADERKRVSGIRKVAEQAGLGEDFVAGLVDDGATIDQAREAALAKLADRDDSLGIRPHTSVGVEERDKVSQAITVAIEHRLDAAVELTDGAQDFVGFSLVEMGRFMLERQGVSTRGLNRARIAEQALHTTSDFPEILANVGNKRLQMAYQNTPRTFVPWCRQATATDFKQMSVAQLGEAPALLEVSESGEFKRGTIGEKAEKYQLATYGRVVGVTRQAIVNDDLSAFSRIIPAMGAQAANLQSDVVYAILTANGNMADGTALFHADHGNQSASAAAPSVTTLGAARAAMRAQKGVDGVTPINVRPRYLIVPVALETSAEQLVTTITPDQAGNVNPFVGNTVVVPEPRLDADSASKWYQAADPSTIDTIEYAFLEGQTGPFIETRNGFDVDGVEIKVRLDFAAKAIDWRGLYRNSA